MTTSTTQPTVSIVGAGLAGAFMAVYLGQRGFKVHVYERRADMRSGAAGAGPSMNLGLSRRGIQALTEIGLIDAAMRMVIPMTGRMIHAVDGSRTFQPYGKDDRQAIYAIKRNDLNIALMNCAESMPDVRFSFEKRCIRIDKESGTAHFHDERTGEQLCARSDIIIGADGVFSTLRQQMQRGERANYQQEFLDWGWKELTIPPGPGGTFRFEKNVFHLWPRGNCMIFAHPNRDGAFCCSCLLPFQGDPSFASLETEADVLAFFQALFGDIVPLTPNLVGDFLRNPIVPLVSIRTDPWYYKDRVVLVGDACHAVYPFYAQGMNAAFEDCLALGECMDRHPGDREAAFLEYQTLRKRNTDALAEMSRQNFVELRDKVRSPLLRTRKKLDVVLSKLFPRTWMPLHAMVTHTTIPYAEALERSKEQDSILKWLGVGLALLSIVPFRAPLSHLLGRLKPVAHLEHALHTDITASTPARIGTNRRDAA